MYSIHQHVHTTYVGERKSTDVEDDDDIGVLRDPRSNPDWRDRWRDGEMASGKLIDINCPTFVLHFNYPKMAPYQYVQFLAQLSLGCSS